MSQTETLQAYCVKCKKKTDIQNSQEVTMKDGMKIEDFAKDLTYKFGIQIAKIAVRTKLLQYGLNVYPKRVKQCITYIDKNLSDRLPQLQELADYYGFKDEKTVCRKEPPNEQQNESKPLPNIEKMTVGEFW